MGGSLTKTPLERRNTVLRRTQRKSVHHIKDKTVQIMKDIKKFKSAEKDQTYYDLYVRIETVFKELETKRQGLQPQINQIYNETQKKIEDCFTFLDSKLHENQAKVVKKHEEENHNVEEASENGDVTVIEEEEEEETEVNETDKRKSVQLHVVKLEPTNPESPPPPSLSAPKRSSILKLGIPVMPGSIMNTFFRKSLDYNEMLTDLRKQIENLEMEVSQFVGRKNGRHYQRLQKQLLERDRKLDEVKSDDEMIKERVKLCKSFVQSCLSFLDERAVDVDVNHDNDQDEDVDDDDDDENEEVFDLNDNRNSQDLKHHMKVTMI